MFPIKAENLHLVRSGVTILDNLSVEIDGNNGITVVMGFNGAGKSVLMRVLNGLVHCDAGRLTSEGEEFSHLNLSKKQTLVLQKPVMLRRTVQENVKYGLRQSNALFEFRDRLWKLLELLEIAHLSKRPARKVSTGEQQRIALARALALDPRLIYLDEPTSSLDPISVKIIEDVINSTSRGGKKIVLVTHSIEQAKRLADDVIFIHRGKVVEHRLAGDFFLGPRSEVARTFLEGGYILNE
ncbi:MAG: ATP-binding cassette domain-containing protein [Pseudomonadota bacterium]|nr:ATP-binding cassette domain-containing protein [Pseudomonadota bacterium]